MTCLADYAAADWSTYVGQARLAAETELGERTVRRLLAELEADGLIRREVRYGSTRGRTSDRIVIAASAIQRLPASMAGRVRRGIYRPPEVVLPATGDRSSGQAMAGDPYVNLTEPSRAREGTEPRALRAESGPRQAGGILRDLVSSSAPGRRVAGGSGS